MPLDVAKVVVGQLSRSEGFILDPMSGSGTTAAAAQALGRKVVAFDSDPLATVLATARCCPAPPDPLNKAVRDVAAQAQYGLKDIDLENCRSDLASPSEVEFLDRWFPFEVQRQLFALIRPIRTEYTGRLQNSLLALFSSMIITKQGGVTYGLDVSRSRAHFCADKCPAMPLLEWSRRAPAFIRHAENMHALAARASCVIAQGDARALPLADGKAELILTSPPYLDAIDYMRAHRFALIWFGYPMADLREVRGRAIGSERGLYDNALTGRLEDLVTSSSAESRRKAILRRFVYDLMVALRESRRCMRPGGIAIYVVGPSLLSRQRYDGGDVLSVIARQVLSV